MTAKQFIKLLDPVVKAAMRTFDAATKSSQEILYAEILKALSNLTTDVAGNILPTAENMRIMISAIQAAVARSFSSPSYAAALREYVKFYDEAVKISNAYFSVALDAFNPLDARLLAQKEAAIVQTIQRLAGAGVQGRVTDALTGMLQASVTSGGGYDVMAQMIRDAVVGDGGILERHVKTAAHDAIMEFNRSYTATVASSYNMTFYLYDGGKQDTTRDFCDKRRGRYFHKKEIEGWASLSWAGKNPATTATSIFVYCGGYNCNHRLVPVDSAVVPREYVERAKSKNYISDEEYEAIIQRSIR